MKTIELDNGAIRIVAMPDLGGALARFDHKRGDDWQPLMRPMAKATNRPFDLACNVLVPWSNRISGGGFTFDGCLHLLEPNLKGEPFPIHGNGFQSSWDILDHSRNTLALQLVSDGPGPFLYKAELTYLIEDETLVMSLTVTNRADIALPFGGGFHPWFPRTPKTTLKAAAHEVWLEGDDHLPTEKIAVADRAAWDFSATRALPKDWINNAFLGWDGGARIEWPETSTVLEIEAAESLPIYILHSPGAHAGYFCLEPVSHTVDAHNLAGGAIRNGLVSLTPLESMQCSCRFTAS